MKFQRGRPDGSFPSVVKQSTSEHFPSRLPLLLWNAGICYDSAASLLLWLWDFVEQEEGDVAGLN